MIRASDPELNWSAQVAAALVILITGATSPLAAQAGSLRGHVVRADWPVGLADAYIELRPSGARTRTDARGFFEVRGFAPGRVELNVRRVGFAPAVVVVHVDPLTVTEVEIPLEPIQTILDPVVTSVARDSRSLSEVAAAVSVADTFGIRRDRTVGVHETLRMIPGVQAASRYGMDDVKLGIRGSAARAGLAVRGVAVLLDGIPLTESDGVARLDLIELASSRQIEVVRGPVSALYAGSPSGMMNVVSRTGRDSRGVSARALSGAFGFRKYDGHVGGMFADRRGSGFASASYTAADGYRAHSDGDVLRGQVALDYVVAPGTQVAIQANGSRLDTSLPGSQSQTEFDADPDAAAPAAVSLGLGRGDNRYRAGLRLQQVLGTGMASGYLFYGGRSLRLPTAIRIVDLNLHRIQGGARLRADHVADLPVNTTVGFDYDDIYGTDQRWRNVGGARGSRDDDGYFSVPNVGAYSQVEWQGARSTSVTFGLRYDRVTYRFESYTAGLIPEQEKTFEQLSPRLSVVGRVDSLTTIYASMGRGFEVPAIGELSQNPGAPLAQSLRPKSLWNYEVGARRIVGGRALLDASVSYADVRGEFVPRTIDNVSRPENASRSRNIGVELGVTALATRNVELMAGYAFLDLRLTDYTSALLDSTGALRDVDFRGKRLPAVPRHRFTSEARVRPLSSLDLGVQLEWQSVVYVETGNAEVGTWYFRPQASAPVQHMPFRAIPARTLVHLNAAWRLGPATLFGSVENLFGLKYAGNVVANESFGRFYESGSPTSVSVGLSLTGWAPSGAR
jgi:iron complex outermembrane recepter protein